MRQAKWTRERKRREDKKVFNALCFLAMQQDMEPKAEELKPVRAERRKRV